MPPIDFLNFRSIAVFICILQGIIFAGLLIVRGVRLGTKADIWLAVLLLVLSSSLVTPFIGFANVYDNNQWLTYFPFSIAYSYGVLVWLYTTNLTDARRKFTIRELLLFLPTASYLTFRLFLFSHTVEWKGWFGTNYGAKTEAIVFVTETGWNLIFLYLSIRHYRKYRRWLNENFSDTEKIKFDWLRNFLYVFSLVVVIGAVFDFTNSMIVRLSYIQYFYFELVLAAATYCLALAGYLRSQTIELTFTDDPVNEAETKRQLLADNDLNKMREKLVSFMSAERPYLEPNLTLTDLARMLGVNSTVLSYVINQGFDKNFNDLINEHRVAEVKSKLLRSEDSVLSIAFDSGFNSKATFNRAFKKFTGLSPKEYQDTAKK